VQPRLDFSVRAHVTTTLRLLIGLAMLAMTALGCGDNIKVNNDRPDASITRPDGALGTAKAITAFSFDMSKNAGLTNDVTASITGTAITATVPSGTTVTALVATFTTTGTGVKVGATSQASGTTPNDFSSPVDYTVTAADGSTQVYTVTVTIASSSAKAITDFKFEVGNTVNATAGLTADIDGDITGTSITATVPFQTVVTGLVATFSTTGVSVKVGSTVQISGTTANDFTASVDYIVTAADNSTQTYTVTVSIAASSAKEIKTFSFESVNNNPALSVNAIGQISGNTITVILPFNTDRTNLVASFTFDGETVKIGTTAQISDETVNDFSAPLEYIVTAADGSTVTYTVTVDNSQSGDKEITRFAINGVEGILNGSTFTLTLPNNTDRTALEPEITITGKSVSPGDGVAHDFTTAATYTVTAFDNTTKSYTVIVLLAGANDKDITRFTINGLDAIIASTGPTTGIITINMPNGTDLTNLTPVVTYTGISVTPDSGVPGDFSNPVNYVVTAQNGTTKTYVVNVGVVNGNGTKVITSFTILGVSGLINNGSSATVTIVLPAGTDLTAQTPTIVINASSISPPSRVPQDFSVPVIYTVRAADGSTRVYTVNVSTL
jgi:hypothetical protein